MDSALKARKLGSATARRKRIEERQLQQHLAHQSRVERRKHIMSDVHSSDEHEENSDVETSSNPDLDSAAETPSESSVRTPEDSLLSPDAFVTLSPTLYNAETGTITARSETQELVMTMSKPQVRPKMQATLTTIADWNYDRFSIFIDPSEVELETEEIPEEEEEEEEEESSSSDEELEECSRIEIATPVSYTMPRIRPSVVSITRFQTQTNSINVDLTMKKRPIVRRHVSEQLASELPRQSFKVAEHKLFQISNSSRETVESTYASSQASRSVSLASQNESTISRSTSQTSQSDQSNRSPKRKSTLPLLFGSNKGGHSRMSSIKKFIRSSTLGPPMSNQAYNSSLQRMPSTSTLETHFESRTTSMEISREVIEQPRRPMTARVPSPTLPMSDSITALPPTFPAPIPAEPDSNTSINGNEVIPTKPSSKFRSRSGSFGQALKSISSGPKRTDVSAPPVPTIFIPPPSEQVDLAGTPSPPPLTPRNPRRSMATYSPFPVTVADKRTSSLNVGLGLRY